MNKANGSRLELVSLVQLTISLQLTETKQISNN